MAHLIVKLVDVVTKASWIYRCDRSPILIGRGRASTITIARNFVSHLHATIRFDEKQITYTDLDSLNGTLIDGRPIQIDDPVVVTADSDVILGRRIRLVVSRTDAAETVPDRINPFTVPEGVSPEMTSAEATRGLTDADIAEIHGAVTKQVNVDAAIPTERPQPAEPTVPALDLRAGAQVPSPRDRELGMATEPGLLPPRTRLGRYYIVRSLAVGGMGAIYRAEDPQAGQVVAIKTLAPEFADRPEARERFLREAKLACRVNHRNIIKIFGYDVHEGVPYLIMEYLRGQGLNKAIEHGPLAIDRAVGIAAAVCAGMSAVHEHGIVHRDIKPSNIFLADTDEGELVKVLDFGVSKLRSGRDPKLTGMNAVIGSLFYMSPEQTRGGVELEARSDQYSIAVVLYECLTGRRPHTGDTLYAISESIARGTFRPLREHDPRIPVDLDAIVAKAMSLAPGNRFGSLRQLGMALLPYASVQAQRQLTDLLSDSPRRFIQAQMSEPIPAEWFQGQTPADGGPAPLDGIPKPRVRTESADRFDTGAVNPGPGPASTIGVEGIAGGTRLLPETEAKAVAPSRPITPRRPLRSPSPVTNDPSPSDSSTSSGARGDVQRRPQRRGVPWRAVGMVTVGALLGAALLWLFSPVRAPESPRPVSATSAPEIADSPAVPSVAASPTPAITPPAPTVPQQPASLVNAPEEAAPRAPAERLKHRESRRSSQPRPVKQQWTGNKTRIIE